MTVSARREATVVAAADRCLTRTERCFPTLAADLGVELGSMASQKTVDQL